MPVAAPRSRPGRSIPSVPTASAASVAAASQRGAVPGEARLGSPAGRKNDLLHRSTHGTAITSRPTVLGQAPTTSKEALSDPTLSRTPATIDHQRRPLLCVGPSGGPIRASGPFAGWGLLQPTSEAVAATLGTDSIFHDAFEPGATLWGVALAGYVQTQPSDWPPMRAGSKLVDSRCTASLSSRAAGSSQPCPRTRRLLIERKARSQSG